MGKKACFLFRTSPNNLLWPFQEKTSYEKDSNFWAKSWVKPLKKRIFREYMKCKFLRGYQACFLFKQYFMAFLSTKQAMNKKSQIFGQNHGLTPLKKSNFAKK